MDLFNGTSMRRVTRDDQHRGGTGDVHHAGNPSPARRRVRRVAAIAGLAIAASPAVSLAAAPQAHVSKVSSSSVRTSSATLSVSRGNTVKDTIRTIATKRVASTTRLVTFRATGVPSGATATFRPTTVKQGVSSTLILRTRSSTPLGRYTIDVAATTSVRVVHARRARVRRTRRRVAVKVAVVGAPGSSGGQDNAATNAPANIDATHIETWSFDDGCNGGTGASAGLVQSWLTYAESNCGSLDTKALDDCNASGVTYCTAVEYLDTNHIYGVGSVPILLSAQENWWLHEPGSTDSAHRLTTSGYGGGNILNQANPAVDAWFKNYAEAYNSYPALMMDDSPESLSQELYGTGYTTSDEITSDTGLAAAHEQMAAAMTRSDGTPFTQIDNGLSPNPSLTPPFSMLNNPSSVTGLITEGAPEDDGTLTPFYGSLLDEMAYVDHTNDDFIVLLSYDTSGSTQSRRVQAATTLLGYAAGHTVSWSDLETNSGNLAVWPEEGIVPTDAVQTMSEPGGAGCFAATGVSCSTGGHNNLQVAPGVYRREFGACYNRGTLFGDCATIVNTTGSPVTVKSSWLTQTYSSEITMNGGDVQSGGTVNLKGAPFNAGTTSVPADDAALLS